MDTLSRRDLLQKLAAAAVLAGTITWRPKSAAAAEGPGPPLISESDPAAKAVKYVENAAKAQGATPGSNCANCALYQGKSGSKDGPCQIFPGKTVVAAGWCASWAPQM